MPSSPKIPKEMILEYALKILIRDGYEALNIKTIAKEIGCSTQPISWHFGNMDGLRQELSKYARDYAIDKLMKIDDNAIMSFLTLGINYINIAREEPNLFHYIFMNGCKNYIASDISMFSDVGQNAVITQRIAQQFGIDKQLASVYVQDLTLYAHGLASYIATGVLQISNEDAKKMLMRVGTAFFA